MHRDEIIKDANRYRWLRDRSENVIIDLVSLRTWENVAGYKTQLDALIDRELSKATLECLQMAEVITDQREWVGLTDEEVSAVIGGVIGFNSCSGWEEDFARAIEAKLKEKNA